MTPLTRAELQALGFRIPPEGGLATRVSEPVGLERSRKQDPEPLARARPGREGRAWEA